ncbi:hypothetical protein [Pseudoxanthomonas sp.]|uniref:hypothetical protein n=1 Tax=Pseudoxanthomonas sp. TaxID=1871049 RepID=UPI0026028E68|nr:hypothetical protein [Pseudoxanthomonas sp.]WDS35517.1 MAG: hypothetical protein O8I58_14375 [Pseudoxanthomonas sp.]
MSNNSYLIVGTTPGWPYAPDGELFSDAEILLYAPLHVPLLWLCLFVPEDIAPVRRGEMSGEPNHCMVSVAAEVAVSRLKARIGLLDSLFGQQGSLSHHCGLLADYLLAHARLRPWLVLDMTELTDLHGGDDGAVLGRIFRQLHASDPMARTGLLEWSTVYPDVPFITLDRAGVCNEEEMHNFFRLMGTGYSRRTETPWD